MLLTERFSRLEWIVSPRNNRMRTLHLYVLFATRSACMACGAPGDYDTPAKGARSLMLCEEHRAIRRADWEAFSEALFPGTPPGVHMKL